MARENIVICTTLVRINLALRVNIIFILLSIFTYFQTTRKPYITDKMNDLEKYAIMVALYMIFLALNQVMNANETYILLGTIIMIALTVFYIIMWMKEYIVFFKKDLGLFIKHNSKLIRDMIKKGSQVYRKSKAQKGTFTQPAFETPT